MRNTPVLRNIPVKYVKIAISIGGYCICRIATYLHLDPVLCVVQKAHHYCWNSPAFCHYMWLVLLLSNTTTVLFSATLHYLVFAPCSISCIIWLSFSGYPMRSPDIAFSCIYRPGSKPLERQWSWWFPSTVISLHSITMERRTHTDSSCSNWVVGHTYSHHVLHTFYSNQANDGHGHHVMAIFPGHWPLLSFII